MIERRAQRILRSSLIVAALAGVLATPASAVDANDSTLQRQRDAFASVWDDVVDGLWPLEPDTARLLQTYPLWPDIVAAHYSASLDSTNTRARQQFMQTHAALAPIKRLRYRIANAAITQGNWQEFGALYDAHYRDANIAAFDCAALAAVLRGDLRWPVARRNALAEKLWLVGTSQDRRCDTPFDVLRRQGFIDDALVEARLQLAIERRRFSLANYLARSLDKSAQASVAVWKRAHQQPEQFLRTHQQDQATTAEMVAHAARRLAVRDAVITRQLWLTASRRFGKRMPDELSGEVLRTIGLAAAQDREPQALQWLLDIPASATDQRVLEWRARAAMQSGDWSRVLQAVAQMAPEFAAQDRWRYWEATALREDGQRAAGDALMTELAKERSYHGYLAADTLDLDYRFNHDPIDVTDAALTAVAKRNDVRRARELLAVGQTDRARRELSDAQRTMNDAELTALAALTHRWDWHPEAIAVLGKLRAYDDLSIRFPLAFDELIRTAAKRDRVPGNWVRGIARTESLFQVDAKSSAGAYGLMQLLPGTAKQQAKTSGVRWRGTQSLFDADTNVRLGSAHLASLYDRFEHTALATAAYNAGAHRVQRWTENVTEMPAEIWIESIAYDETRRYVERVLFAEVVFAWRQGHPITRISQKLPPVGAKQSPVAAVTRLYSAAND